MSTAREQLNRVVKSLTLVTQRNDFSVVIPPQILLNTRAIVYFKKLHKGTQRNDSAAGVLFKRTGVDTWSNPVCVYMHRSDVYWGKLPRVDRSDVFVLLTDPEALHTFELYGQIGFTDHCGKLKRGIMMENSEDGATNLAELVSETPALMRDDDSFAYGACDGRVFSVDIESFMLRVKDSSTRKFYESRDASARTVLDGSTLCPHPDKATLIASAHEALSRYIDIRARHPELAAMAEERGYAQPAAPETRARPPPPRAHPPPPQRHESPDAEPQPAALTSPFTSPPRETALGSHASSESFYSSASSAYGSSQSLGGGSSHGGHGNGFLSPTPEDLHQLDARDRGWSQASDSGPYAGDAVGGALDPAALALGRGPALSVASQFSARRNSTLSAKSRGSSLGGWDDGGSDDAEASMMGTWAREHAAAGRARAASERRPSLATIPQGAPLPRTDEEAAQMIASKMQAAALDAEPRARVNSFDFAG